MKTINIAAVAVIALLIPAVVVAQVIYPNRGGTGNSTAPGKDQVLIGNGSAYDLKRLTAGDNVTIATSSNLITISASLTGGSLTTEDIDTESELEAILTDVTNVFTNNDGALNDDNLSNDDTDDLTEGASNLYFTNERAQDQAGGMVSGNTETRISVTYQDGDGTLDFAVDGNLSSYTNDAGFLTSVGPTNLTSTDFGAFTCNGTTCSLDATYLTTVDISDNTNLTVSATGLQLSGDAIALATGFLIPSTTVATNWNTAFLWGNHASAGYITDGNTNWDNSYGFITSADDTVSGTELDGVFSTTGLLKRTGAGTYTTITDGSANWDTAFGWGNHASQGYLTGNQTITLSGDASGSGATSITVAVSDDSHAHTGSTISGLDISSDTNLTAGRSLTLTGDDVLADAELYTDSKTIYFENPVAADDFKTLWVAPTAVTITSISCESDQTVNFDLQVDDGSATGVNGSDIACTTFATDSSLAGDTTLASGDRIDLALTSVSGTPTWVSITFAYTKDD